MNAGFIGLGALGHTIARRMIEQGVTLTVWNRTAGKAADLDARTAASPAALAREVPLVFLCLRDSPAVEAVLDGPEGLLSVGRVDRLIVDLSTNHFEPVVRFHAMVRQTGGAYLEAPVLGSVIPASQGKLTTLVSGAADALAAARPFLERFCQRIFALGEPGRATKMKLVNNLVLGSLMATLAEALVLGEAIGLEKAQVLEILAAGAGNSAVLQGKMQKLLAEDFSPHFSAGLIDKDLRCLQDLARTLDRPLRTGLAPQQIFARALEQRRGDEDFSVAYAILKG